MSNQDGHLVHLNIHEVMKCCPRLCMRLDQGWHYQRVQSIVFFPITILLIAIAVESISVQALPAFSLYHCRI